MKCELDTVISRIESFILKNFIDCQSHSIFKDVCTTLGMRKFLKTNGDMVLKSLQLYFFSRFVEENSLDFEAESANLKQKKIEANNGPIRQSNSCSLAVGASAGTTYATNHVKAYEIDTIVVTGIPEIDNYFKYSVIANKIYERKESLRELEKLQLIQTVRYLSAKSDYIRGLLKKQSGTRFSLLGQDILSDYFYLLESSNLKMNTDLGKMTLVPYLVELTGKPGVGKSTFVDYFSQLINQLLPFYAGTELLYTRVNDKFWNGYKQQPLVLYDDPNQNKKLLYDLDNEIIMLGGGRFVHPPMAFEKETKFTSLFVLYTTNTKLVKTTQVNGGAIARRLNTYTVNPQEDLGEWIETEYGQYWRYDDDVCESPFNVNFGGENYLAIFSRLLIKQMKSMIKKNVSSNPFTILTQRKELEFQTTVDERLASYVSSIFVEKKHITGEALVEQLEEKPELSLEDKVAEARKIMLKKKEQIMNLTFIDKIKPQGIDSVDKIIDMTVPEYSLRFVESETKNWFSSKANPDARPYEELRYRVRQSKGFMQRDSIIAVDLMRLRNYSIKARFYDLVLRYEQEQITEGYAVLEINSLKQVTLLDLVLVKGPLGFYTMGGDIFPFTMGRFSEEQEDKNKLCKEWEPKKGKTTKIVCQSESEYFTLRYTWEQVKCKLFVSEEANKFGSF